MNVNPPDACGLDPLGIGWEESDHVRMKMGPTRDGIPSETLQWPLGVF